MQYFEDAKIIWQSFVPKSGQAETVQGELLRAVEKLRDEATRNGNCNWDQEFVILLAYLERHLLDPGLYSPETLHETKAALDRLKDYEHPCLEDDLYDELDDRVVEYFKSYGSQPHERNPDLHR